MNRTIKSRVMIAIIPLLMLFIAACGGGGGDKEATVSLKNTAFNPTSATIAKGGVIHFKNEDTAIHNVVQGKNGQKAADAKIDSGTIKVGETKDLTFTDAGTVNLTCTFHPQMAMTVTVQ